ncbi:MAG: hypothetical protein ACRERC_09255 [Candidatus Binatia bacterium]
MAARRAAWWTGAWCAWFAAVGAWVQPALAQVSFVDTVTAGAASVTTPTVCALTVTAAAQVPGHIDPTPADNTALIELLLLDANDF